MSPQPVQPIPASLKVDFIQCVRRVVYVALFALRTFHPLVPFVDRTTKKASTVDHALIKQVEAISRLALRELHRVDLSCIGPNLATEDTEITEGVAR
jgi:hypothetical protein